MTNTGVKWQAEMVGHLEKAKQAMPMQLNADRNSAADVAMVEAQTALAHGVCALAYAVAIGLGDIEVAIAKASAEISGELGG